MQKLYAFLSTLGTPLWRFLLNRRVRLGKEDAGRLPERWGIPSQNRPAGSLIWIHGASVGESLSTLGLIEALQRAFPHIVLLMTTGTRSSALLLKLRLPPQVIHQMVPCDVPKSVQHFLDFWKPSLAIFIESDLWPNLLAQTQNRGIPTVLLNGRISEKSFKRLQWVRPLFSPLLKQFKICFVSSALQAQRLSSLGAFTKLAGNLKFTTPFLTCDEQELNRLKKVFGQRPLWLAASTHPGEEALLLKAHQKLRQIFPKLLLILAPRHPHRVLEIQGMAEKMALSALLYSDEKECIEPLDFHTVFLVDTLGDLGLFYRLSPLVFMGGSFVSVGGHNLIEPAQLGCAVLHGPLMENNQDVADAFAQAAAAWVVANEGELVDKVQLLLKDSEERDTLVHNACTLLSAQTKILDEVVESVAQWIPACRG